MPMLVSDPENAQQYLLRPAAIQDAAIISLHRAAMFRDMGEADPARFELVREASQPWLEALIAAQAYRGWLFEHAGIIVAGGGLLLRELGPVPGCPRAGNWAHIVNVYTEPAHRRRGLARRLMLTMIGWCKANAIDHVTLSASHDGRPLYESLGFHPTSDMRLIQP